MNFISGSLSGGIKAKASPRSQKGKSPAYPMAPQGASAPKAGRMTGRPAERGRAPVLGGILSGVNPGTMAQGRPGVMTGRPVPGAGSPAPAAPQAPGRARGGPRGQALRARGQALRARALAAGRGGPRAQAIGARNEGVPQRKIASSGGFSGAGVNKGGKV